LLPLPFKPVYGPGCVNLGGDKPQVECQIQTLPETSGAADEPIQLALDELKKQFAW
jgi:hypothetical protein